jgi:hypothetical protein
VGKKKKKTAAPASPRETSVNGLGVAITVLLILGLAAAVIYVGRIPSNP